MSLKVFARAKSLKFPQLRLISMVHSKGVLENAKVLSVTPMDSSESRWVQMDKIRYLAPDGKERDWEMTSRKTRLEGALVDGVGILAILKSGSEPQVLLQKQFRPPVEGICIEIPAGLIDPAESITECALRELKEETGYKGSVVEQSGVMFNDPGFTNTNMSMVIVNIDLEDPENQNPVPELEENEFIETFAVPLATLDTELAELEKAGYRVDARLFNVAIGLKIAREFKLF